MRIDKFFSEIGKFSRKECAEKLKKGFITVNGEIVKTAPLGITSYGNWDTATIGGIEYSEGDTLNVGIFAKCQGAGNGAWGKIDDAMLNSLISQLA